MSLVGRFFSFSGSLYKPFLKFRVCAETCRTRSANYHTPALACTGKTGQLRTYTDGQRRATVQQNTTFVSIRKNGPEGPSGLAFSTTTVLMGPSNPSKNYAFSSNTYIIRDRKNRRPEDRLAFITSSKRWSLVSFLRHRPALAGRNRTTIPPRVRESRSFRPWRRSPSPRCPTASLREGNRSGK